MARQLLQQLLVRPPFHDGVGTGRLVNPFLIIGVYGDFEGHVSLKPSFIKVPQKGGAPPLTGAEDLGKSTSVAEHVLNHAKPWGVCPLLQRTTHITQHLCMATPEIVGAVV